MDNITLKKKLSTYLTEGGQLRNVNEELLYEVLTAWENWTGTSKEFYKSIGFTQKQMATLIGKAKKLKREGHFGGEESFKEVHIEGYDEVRHQDGVYLSSPMIELHNKGGQVIRFPQVHQLIDYLKNAS